MALLARARLISLAAGGAALLASSGAFTATRVEHHPIIALNANQSGNWSGYVLGTLAYHNTRFTSITSQWRVPKATARRAHDAEYSSTWIGIGGGCINADCSLTDPATLIQTGTEQDVVNGVAQYSAWWEIIPEPSTPINRFAVGPGDLMYASISQGLPGQWTITLKDLSRGESFSVATPYASSGLSAEWITETPVIINGAGSGVASLPNLSGNTFDRATVNGKAPGLTTANELQLYSPPVIATPSAPESDRDGFNVCSYATSCAAPTSS